MLLQLVIAGMCAILATPSVPTGSAMAMRMKMSNPLKICGPAAKEFQENQWRLCKDEPIRGSAGAWAEADSGFTGVRAWDRTTQQSLPRN